MSVRSVEDHDDPATGTNVQCRSFVMGWFGRTVGSGGDPGLIRSSRGAVG